jgi:hypothetical protein
MRPRDTSPEAWKFQMDLIRKLSPAEKLQRAIDFTNSVRKLGEAGVRSANPQASEREIFLLIAQRQLGKDFQKVFGDEWRAYGPAKRHA